MRNLITRSISGFVYVTLFLFAILYDAKSYIALTGIFAIICIWEFSKLIKSKNIIPYLFLGGMIYFFINPIKDFSSEASLGFTITGLLILIYLLFSSKKIKVNTIFRRLFLQLVYLVLPFYFLISIPFIFGEYQPKILIWVLIFIWVNDSFAYLVGKNFGKTKLFESVSPKKTIEGFIGGLVFSLIAAFFITQQHNNPNINLMDWMIIAVVLSVFGTIGDLIESKFKRQANIKDSGNIMPGHGGLLDRLDSLFFAAPFVYLYLYFII
jgi:phosphatidate cytidylyltransferase